MHIISALSFKQLQKIIFMYQNRFDVKKSLCLVCIYIHVGHVDVFYFFLQHVMSQPGQASLQALLSTLGSCMVCTIPGTLITRLHTCKYIFQMSYM